MTSETEVKQLAASLVVTDKLLKQHNEAINNNIQRMAMGAMVRRMVLGRTKSIELFSEEWRRPDLRGYEISMWADVIPDDSMASLVAQAVELQGSWSNAVRVLNDVPWYKLLWWKLTRRPLVTLEF